MKKVSKVLAIAVAAAAVVPYKVEENIETGEKTWDALLWRFTSRPGADGEAQKELSILPCRCPRKKAAEEAEMFEDELTYCSPDPWPDIVESDEPGPF